MAAWESCTNLSDFEQTLHDIQARDVYYAKPRLLQKSGTGEIGAFYTLTEECESVFPVRVDGFLNLSELKVKEGFVRFVLYSEQRTLDAADEGTAGGAGREAAVRRTAGCGALPA